MSDARSLLRAKRAESEVRISHPYAAYNASGQLRCTACVITIKNNAAWNGHVGSKGHRTAVAAIKAKELEAEQKRLGKRKESEPEDVLMKDGTQAVSGDAKKARLDDGNTASAATHASSFPDDFFSDPSRELPQPDEADEGDAGGASRKIAPPQQNDPLTSIVDREFEDFLKDIKSTTAPVQPEITEEEFERRERWNRATVIAEPEIAEEEVPEGFPVLEDTQPEPETEEEKKMLEERRKQKMREHEDRELIMDRLIEEEQAQEDADNRVVALKERLEQIKRRKEAAKSLKVKGTKP